MRPVGRFDPGTDGGDRRSRRVHLHRLTGDVEAHPSTNAVRLPGRHPPLLVALGDEAVVVVLVPAILAPAEAGNLAEDLGMVRREVEDRLDDVHRPRGRKWYLR